jgi:hypothetical protein
MIQSRPAKGCSNSLRGLPAQSDSVREQSEDAGLQGSASVRGQVVPRVGGASHDKCHSGGRAMRGSPELMNTGLWKMDTGIAAEPVPRAACRADSGAAPRSDGIMANLVQSPPEGGLSCGRCMISTIAPVSLSFNRLFKYRRSTLAGGFGLSERDHPGPAPGRSPRLGVVTAVADFRLASLPL